MAFLEIKDLSFRYPLADKKAVDGLSLSLNRGEILTVLGPTGSGKSTMLRLMKPELRQNGELSGVITVNGTDISVLSPAVSASTIGYVTQDPDEQIVTDKVWHELAFTLENMGEKQGVIARRAAEAASYFGIESWYHRSTSELSGGQKQLLNLASVMTADPELLLLDEPTAQLDPISASRFIEAVRKLNRETGLTVIITEHRSEELIPISDKLLILDGGKAAYYDSPRAVASRLGADSPYLSYMPCAARVFAMLGESGDCPLSIREGSRKIEEGYNRDIASLDEPHHSDSENGETALELDDLYFRYRKNDTDILKGMSLKLRKGEVFALLGANGSGKSTAAAVAAGLRRPYSGRVRLFGQELSKYKNGSLYSANISLLPQDVESVFVYPTVKEELKGCESVLNALPFYLSRLYNSHPYDLSGGEKQLVALCKALSTEPRLLIMDEPSKGLDPVSKTKLAELILTLRDRGVTVLAVTHDVEFAAACADRCALLFDGAIAACSDTARFMSANRFYTTPASRMTRGLYEGAYTAERAARLMELNGRRL